MKKPESGSRKTTGNLRKTVSGKPASVKSPAQVLGGGKSSKMGGKSAKPKMVRDMDRDGY